ncbi:RidA family protein [Gammaproteobacteria bacterium]|nr:RidA family protein [Gammaproteobacteria bacterium]
MPDKVQQVIYPTGASSYYQDWKFSPAIKCNGFLFVSGCTGTPDNGIIAEEIGAQTRQAFFKIQRCLNDAHTGFSDIVEITTYHVGLSEHLEAFILVKNEFIVEPYPAWTAVGVSELAAAGALVEIKVVAKLRSS